MPQTISLALVGLGNVGQRVLQLLIEKEAHIKARYDLAFKLVGVADSSGAAIAHNHAGERPVFGLAARSDGLDPQEILKLKQAKQGIATLPKVGHSGMSAAQMLDAVDAGVMLEMSPTNLQDGGEGLRATEAAIAKGMHVVLASKGPLVVAYPKLAEAAHKKQVRLAFSASVAGGLPTVNLGRRDLNVARIERIEGILNGTTNYILTSMAEQGVSYADALAEAQRRGIAETDPTLDVEGYDAASKLLILAHAALDYHATLNDVERVGITAVTMADLTRAKAEGKVIKLLCVAARDGDQYKLSVKPTALPATHPMARLSAGQMGVLYDSDVNGEIVAIIEEGNPMPTAAAVVRDLINLYWQA